MFSFSSHGHCTHFSVNVATIYNIFAYSNTNNITFSKAYRVHFWPPTPDLFFWIANIKKNSLHGGKGTTGIVDDLNCERFQVGTAEILNDWS